MASQRRAANAAFPRAPSSPPDALRSDLRCHNLHVKAAGHRPTPVRIPAAHRPVAPLLPPLQARSTRQAFHQPDTWHLWLCLARVGAPAPSAWLRSRPHRRKSGAPRMKVANAARRGSGSFRHHRCRALALALQGPAGPWVRAVSVFLLYHLRCTQGGAVPLPITIQSLWACCILCHMQGRGAGPRQICRQPRRQEGGGGGARRCGRHAGKRVLLQAAPPGQGEGLPNGLPAAACQLLGSPRSCSCSTATQGAVALGPCPNPNRPPRRCCAAVAAQGGERRRRRHFCSQRQRLLQRLSSGLPGERYRCCCRKGEERGERIHMRVRSAAAARSSCSHLPPFQRHPTPAAHPPPRQGVANVAEAVKETGGQQRVVLVSSCLVRWLSPQAPSCCSKLLNSCAAQLVPRCPMPALPSPPPPLSCCPPPTHPLAGPARIPPSLQPPQPLAPHPRDAQQLPLVSHGLQIQGWVRMQSRSWCGATNTTQHNQDMRGACSTRSPLLFALCCARRCAPSAPHARLPPLS